MRTAFFIGHMTEGKPGGTMKLDVKDRKILYELSKNARFPVKRIAKQVGLSREVVDYRLEQMMKSGLLTGFTTLIDLKKLGHVIHIIYLQMKSMDKETEKRLIDMFVDNRKIIWVVTCGGRYDIGLMVDSRSLDEFEGTFHEIVSLCGDYLGNIRILNEVKYEYLGLGLLLEGVEEYQDVPLKDSISFHKEFKRVRPGNDIYILKDREKRLLELMTGNARIRILELSEKLGVSTKAVKSMIKGLINNGVIVGFMPMVSFYLQGYEWYKTFLRYTMSREEEARLFAYLRKHPNILWYMKVIGNWNMSLSIFAKDTSHFREILNDIRSRFSIRDYDHLIIFNQYKSMV